MATDNFKFRKFLKSFVYAWRGILSVIRKEQNAWIHCVAIIIVSGAGFFFEITKGEWIAVILCFGVVLASETFNSAIERLVDMVSPEIKPIAGNIKDMAAGAVLICAITSAIIGLIIFIPYIINYSL